MCRALGQLGETMLHETKAHDQAQRNRSPPSDRKSPWQVERNVPQRFLGISCRTQNSVHVLTATFPSSLVTIFRASGRMLCAYLSIHFIELGTHAVGSDAIGRPLDIGVPPRR